MRGAVAGSLVVVVVANVTGGGGGGGNVANAWIDSNGGTCARQSPAGAYSDAGACSTIQAAYAAANAGDAVSFKCGTGAPAGNAYNPSQINVTEKTSGANVVFAPETGCVKVTATNGIDILQGSRMEFRDVDLGASGGDIFYLRPGADHITFRRMHAECGFIRGADDVAFIDSEIGPSTCTSFFSADVTSCPGACPNLANKATNVLIDNVTWHDIYSLTTADHTDNIGIDGTDGLTIRNSEFTGCENACLIFGNDFAGGGGSINTLIENNVFACCWDGLASGNAPGGNNVVWFGNTQTNTVFRFNSHYCVDSCGFKITDTVGTDTRGPDFVVDSNVFTDLNSGQCTYGSAAWSNNISVAVTGGSCSGVSTAATGWVSNPSCCPIAGLNFNLGVGAAAVNAGNQSSFPSTDANGVTRVAGSVDAGAFER